MCGVSRVSTLLFLMQHLYQCGMAFILWFRVFCMNHGAMPNSDVAKVQRGPTLLSAGFSCQSCHSRKTSIPGRAGTTFEAHEFVTILGRTWLERVGVFYSSQLALLR